MHLHRALVLCVLVSLSHAAEHFGPQLTSANKTGNARTQVYPVHSFKMEANYFLFDGQQIVLVGASMHYFRIPREYWVHRLGLLRGAELNTVFVSLEWSTHEPLPGVFKFTGQQDFIYFVRIAEAYGLKVVARPGPFIGEERDFGGYPSWLLWEKPNSSLAYTDPYFQSRVTSYMQELLPRLKPLLAKHGGPVIMLEVTREMSECHWLMQLFRKHVGNDVMFRAYQTGNSPITSLVSTTEGWQEAPLVSLANLWPKHPVDDTTSSYADILRMLAKQLEQNRSVGIGAFHRGTDFEFHAGVAKSGGRLVHYASSFVEAPLSEAGEALSGYMQLKEIMCSFFGLGFLRPGVELASPRRIALGRVVLLPVGCLLDTSTVMRLSTVAQSQRRPATFEALRQQHGFVLYESMLQPRQRTHNATLRMRGLRDRAQVFVDKKLVGVADRDDASSLSVRLGELGEGANLQVFVENMGRPIWDAEQEPMEYYKGLAVDGTVSLDDVEIQKWSMYGLPWNNTDSIHQMVTSRIGSFLGDELSAGMPMLLGMDFEIDKDEAELGDTFLDMRGWGRGVAIINGHVLGKYWADAGPRKALFVPRSFLLPRAHINHVAVLELERLPGSKGVVFRAHPGVFEWRSHYSVAIGLGFVLLITLLAAVFGGGSSRGAARVKRGDVRKGNNIPTVPPTAKHNEHM